MVFTYKVGGQEVRVPAHDEAEALAIVKRAYPQAPFWKLVKSETRAYPSR